MRALFLAIAMLLAANPAAAERVDKEGLVERLQPMLQQSGLGAVVYFRAACRIETGFGELSFPELTLRPVAKGKRGVAAIRAILPARALVKRRAGVLSIGLGAEGNPLLPTRISRWGLWPEQQYNGRLAVMGLENVSEVQAAMREHGYHGPVEDVSILGRGFREEDPHLPPDLFDLTYDEALHAIARKWRGIVFFGACEDRRLFSTTLQGGIGWEPRR